MGIQLRSQKKSKKLKCINSQKSKQKFVGERKKILNLIKQVYNYISKQRYRQTICQHYNSTIQIQDSQMKKDGINDMLRNDSGEDEDDDEDDDSFYEQQSMKRDENERQSQNEEYDFNGSYNQQSYQGRYQSQFNAQNRRENLPSINEEIEITNNKQKFIQMFEEKPGDEYEANEIIFCLAKSCKGKQKIILDARYHRLTHINKGEIPVFISIKETLFKKKILEQIKNIDSFQAEEQFSLEEAIRNCREITRILCGNTTDNEDEVKQSTRLKPIIENKNEDEIQQNSINPIEKQQSLQIKVISDEEKVEKKAMLKIPIINDEEEEEEKYSTPHKYKGKSPYMNKIFPLRKEDETLSSKSSKSQKDLSFNHSIQLNNFINFKAQKTIEEPILKQPPNKLIKQLSEEEMYLTPKTLEKQQSIPEKINAPLSPPVLKVPQPESQVKQPQKEKKSDFNAIRSNAISVFSFIKQAKEAYLNIYSSERSKKKEKVFPDDSEFMANCYKVIWLDSRDCYKNIDSYPKILMTTPVGYDSPLKKLLESLFILIFLLFTVFELVQISCYFNYPNNEIGRILSLLLFASVSVLTVIIWIQRVLLSEIVSLYLQFIHLVLTILCFAYFVSITLHRDTVNIYQQKDVLFSFMIALIGTLGIGVLLELRFNKQNLKDLMNEDGEMQSFEECGFFLDK